MFYSNLPSLDLHGETSETAVILLNDFIRDSLKLRNYKIVIIHGIGKGILRKAVHKELKKNKFVESFKMDFFNPGCTVVELSNLFDKSCKK